MIWIHLTDLVIPNTSNHSYKKHVSQLLISKSFCIIIFAQKTLYLVLNCKSYHCHYGKIPRAIIGLFTGNCFRMVRIVLKITFLELRYPKGVTGSVPLCPIMALENTYFSNPQFFYSPSSLNQFLPSGGGGGGRGLNFIVFELFAILH